MRNRPYKDLKGMLYDEQGAWRHSKVNKTVLSALLTVKMNSLFGTLAKAFVAIVTSSAPAKPPIKKAAVAAAAAADPFSEMEKGRVLEWWVLVADR